MFVFSPQEDHLLGHVVDSKYQLVDVLARSHFGTVFVAQQFFCGQLVRTVAMKVSRQTGLTDANAPTVFRDALILTQLLAGPHHEGKRHLVPIYDMGLLPQFQGRGYLVMEHVDASPLLSHIASAGRIGVPTGLRYLKELCQALALVHSRGAVHRDLEPENIVVDPSGVVRITNFGFAAITDPRFLFAPGTPGNRSYMAPETLLGLSTPAADVYSLGLVAYELFTGGGPHVTMAWPKSGDARTFHQIKTGLQFAPPSQVHNEIRNEYRWLDGLILGCLAVEPENRFPDAGKVLEAIETCEEGGELPTFASRVRTKGTSETPSRSILRDQVSGADELPESLIRKARRHLSRREYAETVDLLDVHRPAEWAVMDQEGAQVLRLLAKAFLGQNDYPSASDCLSQLEEAQHEQSILPVKDFLVVLTDLQQCCEKMGRNDRVKAVRDEIRRIFEAGVQ
ncbi:MAG: serine/threonine protein kinase [Gemmataceae bacterium]